MIIYKATNKNNNKVYVGITTDCSLESRKRNHKHVALSGKSNTPFHRALRKEPDAFVWEIIEQCETWEQLTEREIFWIEKYKANNPKYGYNTHKTRFVSRYKQVIPRKHIKIKLENAETLKAIKLLAINKGVQYNELIEEGIRLVLQKYGKL